MKVTCPGCAKVYDLPRDRIKPEGTKVKCKDCGKLFLVRPKVGAPGDDDFPSQPPVAPSAPAQPPAAPPAGDDLDDFFGASAGASAAAGDDLDDFFGSPGAELPPPDAFDAPAGDLFGGEDDLFSPARNTVPAAAAPAADDMFGDATDLFGDPDPSDSSATPTEARSDKEALDSLFDGGEAAPAPPPAPDFDWDDDPEPTAQPEKLADDPTADDAFAPAIKAQDAEKVLRRAVVQDPLLAQPRSRLGLVFGLIALTVVVGAAGALVMRPDLVDLLLAQVQGVPATAAKPAAKPGEPRIPVVAVNAPIVSREQNRRGSTLLVVQGELRNDDRVPHSFVKAEVKIVDASGAAVTAETVFAGNMLTGLQLRTFAPAELRERLQVEVGDQLSNFNIPPGGVVPYMAVFAPDPTPEGAEISARVRTVASQRGSQN